MALSTMICTVTRNEKVPKRLVSVVTRTPDFPAFFPPAEREDTPEPSPTGFSAWERDPPTGPTAPLTLTHLTPGFHNGRGMSICYRDTFNTTNLKQKNTHSKTGDGHLCIVPASPGRWLPLTQMSSSSWALDQSLLTAPQSMQKRNCKITTDPVFGK